MAKYSKWHQLLDTMHHLIYGDKGWEFYVPNHIIHWYDKPNRYVSRYVKPQTRNKFYNSETIKDY